MARRQPELPAGGIAVDIGVDIVRGTVVDIVVRGVAFLLKARVVRQQLHR